MMATSKWIPCPTLYEINTWVWLTELSRTKGKPIDLSCVPAEEWDRLAEYGFHAVWLMGVWERSPAGIAIANQNKSLVDEFRRVLPDYRPQDNIGSAYCIRRYIVDSHLGGPAGLAVARRELGLTMWHRTTRGSATTRNTSFKDMPGTRGTTRHPLWRFKEGSSPAGATPSFLPGETCCSSTPLRRAFAKPPSIPCPVSRPSVMAFVATCRCFY